MPPPPTAYLAPRTQSPKPRTPESLLNRYDGTAPGRLARQGVVRSCRGVEETNKEQANGRPAAGTCHHRWSTGSRCPQARHRPSPRAAPSLEAPALPVARRHQITAVSTWDLLRLAHKTTSAKPRRSPPSAPAGSTASSSPTTAPPPRVVASVHARLSWRQVRKGSSGRRNAADRSIASWIRVSAPRVRAGRTEEANKEPARHRTRRGTCH